MTRTGQQIGPASLVVPNDKLSILVTISFATFALHEKLTERPSQVSC